jgi:hypothetical protein
VAARDAAAVGPTESLADALDPRAPGTDIHLIEDGPHDIEHGTRRCKE